MKRILLRVTDEEHAQLKAQAEKSGLSMQKYLSRKLNGAEDKQSSTQLLSLSGETKELRTQLPDVLHALLKTSARYHRWSMQDEARAILADALSNAIVVYPKELRELRQSRAAIDKIGRNIRAGLRCGLVSGSDYSALTDAITQQSDAINALVSVLERKSRWNSGN